MANDGGPAFPRTALCDDGHLFEEGATGMSLRDWFAGQTMAGMISNSIVMGTIVSQAGIEGGVAVYSRTAYLVADAMLKARQEGN